MSSIEYVLGKVADLDLLFPPPELAFPEVGLRTREDVVSHYTKNSLIADGFGDPNNVTVAAVGGEYRLKIDSGASRAQLEAFASRHIELFGPKAGMKAVRGQQLMQDLGVWNPMAGFPVNGNPNDGDSKWRLFPPLGLNVIGQRGALLMHYPPWQVLQQATFYEVMTWHRWTTVLTAAGVPADQVRCYGTFVDVNPIAAPGSGESEYPNDYFPIMMASGFFDGGPDRDYIVSMLELYLNPPGHEDDRYTLPLLICGSPLYDPQAPGWFRVHYKEQLKQQGSVDANGAPTVNVLQSGTFRLRPDSRRETPYMVGNHMIAAGVTGLCTNEPGKLPDIRQYEAQDLVAATFLWLLATQPGLSASDAKAQACLRWFGNSEGTGVPKPAKPDDLRTICALAQMDLFFVPTPIPHPLYTFQQAWDRCGDAGNGCNPCAAPIEPPPEA